MFRQPFAIFGALAFLSLLRDIIEIDTTILVVVDAIRDVTRPVWQFLLSWWPYSIPEWLPDYLTMGVIVAGMTVRMRLYWWSMLETTPARRLSIRFASIRLAKFGEGDWGRFYLIDLPLRIVDALLFWPLTMVYRMTFAVFKYFQYSRTPEFRKIWRDGYRIFYETFLWALIIIIANYVLLRGWII